MPTRRCFVCQDDQRDPVLIPAVPTLLTVASVKNTQRLRPSAMNDTNVTLLPREGMAEFGSVSEIATLLPIRFVKSALRKVCTRQPRRYIT